MHKKLEIETIKTVFGQAENESRYSIDLADYSTGVDSQVYVALILFSEAISNLIEVAIEDTLSIIQRCASLEIAMDEMENNTNLDPLMTNPDISIMTQDDFTIKFQEDATFRNYLYQLYKDDLEV